MKRNYRYQSMFSYGSLQSVGHTEEYFVQHTRKLVVYIVMPRLKNQGNLLRIYQEGRLVKEEKIWSSSNFFLYYLSWLWHYWKFILVYFERKEMFVVLSGHPISFFGMTIQKLLRPGVVYAFWIGDYYPPVNWSLRFYELIKKFYHDRVDCRYYLSDIINKILNRGKIIDDERTKTVMWGVKHAPITKRLAGRQLSILFVGLVKEGQGLEVLLSFLVDHRNYTLKIIGICRDELFGNYQALIGQYRIGDRVFFPNKFYSDTELTKLAKICHVGVAMYDVGPLNITYYTDPGKVKTYAELGLPILMTDTSGIASFVKRFGCGEVIQKEEEIEASLEKMQTNYIEYQQGLKKFLSYFAYNSYYRKSFKALEDR